MNEPTQERILAGRLTQIGNEIGKLLDAVAHSPETVRELEDRELKAIAVWNQDSDTNIRAECVRRAEQARSFSAYLDVPTFGEYLLRRALDQP